MMQDTFHWDCRQWGLAQGFASHSRSSSLSGSPLLYLWLPSLSVCCRLQPQVWHQDSSLAETVQPSTTITHYQILMINLLWVAYNLQLILSLWVEPNSENLYQMISILTLRDSPRGPVFNTLRSQYRGSGSSLLRELVPMCSKWENHNVTTKAQEKWINIKKKKKKDLL